MPARHGYQAIWSGIHAAIFAQGATSLPGNSIATRSRWRQACQACSAPEMFAITPLNEYRVEWARVAWPSPLSINTWLYSEGDATDLWPEAERPNRSASEATA